MFQDFTLDFYFRQFWTDPRLAYKKRPGVETLSVGSEFIRNIWVPDTFFVNEKQSYFHIATTSNEFIRIHHSGSITRSIRYLIRFLLRIECNQHNSILISKFIITTQLYYRNTKCALCNFISQTDYHCFLSHGFTIFPDGSSIM